MGLTIVLLIFATQIAYEPLSKFAVEIVGSIHESSLNQFLIIATKFISYAVLFGCMGLFVLQIFYVSPHAVENASSLTFLCLTIYLNSTLKLLFGEIRPYMFAILNKLPLDMYDCETDFGMPSGHVFVGVCFYYLLRMAIFEELEKLETPQKVADESRKSFVNNLVSLKATKQRLGQAKFRFFIFEIKMHMFNLVLLTYIILLAIARVLAASHYTFQVLFGFLTGFSWGWIYFAYLRQPLRSFVHEILAVPNARPKTRRLINLMSALMLAITLAFYLLRKLLRNEIERAVLANFLKVKCNSHMILEDKNLLDSMILLLPIFIFNIYALLPLKKFINAAPELRRVFWDLSKADKLLRFLVFLLPTLFIFIIKVVLDHIIKRFYDYATIFDYLNMTFFLLLLAFLYAVLLPLILDRLSLLLRNEFIEDGGSAGSDYLMQDTDQNDNQILGNQGNTLDQFLRTNSSGRDKSSRNTQLADQLDGRDVRTSNLQDLMFRPTDEESTSPNCELRESIEREISIKESKKDN